MLLEARPDGFGFEVFMFDLLCEWCFMWVFGLFVCEFRLCVIVRGRTVLIAGV